MKTKDKQFHQLLKKLETDFGWSFYDENGKLHLEDLQKQLIGDIMRALSESYHQETKTELLLLLADCRSTLILDSLIDRSDTTKETLKKVEDYIKYLKSK